MHLKRLGISEKKPGTKQLQPGRCRKNIANQISAPRRKIKQTVSKLTGQCYGRVHSCTVNNCRRR